MTPEELRNFYGAAALAVCLLCLLISGARGRLGLREIAYSLLSGLLWPYVLILIARVLSRDVEL